MAVLNAEQLGKNIERLLKIMTLISKIGILIGGICILGYSLRIGHFPQDLTVGDGLLFILTAVCFGLTYLFFVASLISLGVIASPATKLLSKLYLLSYKFRKVKQPQQVFDFAKFQWSYLLFAGFAILLIWSLGKRDSNAYWNLPLLSIGMYFFYSVYLSTGDKIREIEISLKSIVQRNENGIATTGKIENLRKAQMLSLGVLLAMPIFTGGVTGQLLDSAMRQAHVRIEETTVFIKEPYSSLLPLEARAPVQLMTAQYIKFDKVIVLFRGFGKTTVISFVDKGTKKQLEIPNDQLIVNQY